MWVPISFSSEITLKSKYAPSWDVLVAIATAVTKSNSFARNVLPVLSYNLGQN